MSIVIDPWQPSGRSTWPDSANDIEHGYMKLPGRRKMTKIRQIIYEDPGNPFQDELDAERVARGEAVPDCDKALPEAPDEVSPTGRSFFEFDISYDPFLSTSEQKNDSGRSVSLDKPLPSAPRKSSSIATSFHFDSVDNVSNYAPEESEVPRASQESFALPQEFASRPSRGEYHRSMSLAIPSPPPLSEEYVSPRRFWRRENSLPLMKEKPEAKKGPRSGRDTKFYGFYEDLMKHYDKRRSKL